MPRHGTTLSPDADRRNREAIARWKSAHIETLSIGLRKGKRDAYKQLSAARGTSVSAMIQSYMDGECQKEGIKI